MRVQRLMHRPVYTCAAADSLRHAAELMQEHDCGAIPVVDSRGRIVAMITDRDICMAAYTTDKPLSELQVGDGMTQEVYCCHGDDPVEAVERAMSQHQIRRMPVIDDYGLPLGVISLGDLCRYTALQKRGQTLQRELMHTLAAISQPRRRQA